MKSTWQIEVYSIFFSTLIVLFVVIMLLTGTSTVRVREPEQVTELNLAEEIARIEPECFTWYPEALYTPEDFAQGDEPPPRTAAPDGGGDYGTYRIMLPLSPGMVYGLSGYSATYAQAMWVNGVAYPPIGAPGAEAETTTHRASYFTIYFEPTSSPTEIIVQRANFFHAGGGSLNPLYLARQPLLTAMNAANHLRGGLIIGSMLMSCLFFFAVWLLSRRKRYSLWFALACLLIAVRALYTNHKLIPFLLPAVPWAVSHKIEYLVTIGFVFCFLLYVERMLEDRPRRPMNAFGFIMGGTYSVVVLFTPAPVYTQALPYFQAGGILFAASVLALQAYSLWKSPDRRLPGQILVMLWLLVALSLSTFDFLKLTFFPEVNMTQLGMMVFVSANALALVLRLTYTEVELVRARETSREMAETNRLLHKLNRMRSDFLATISHELKTPLTVMSGYAQLVDWQLGANASGQEVRKRLRAISAEAQRLGTLVTGLLHVSVDKHDLLGLASVSPEAILARGEAVIAPVLEKNENRLVTEVESGCPQVRVNADMILQVLLNLCVNANRHMRGGIVFITVRRVADRVVFQVADTGKGIDPALLPTAFERSTSGDGRTGLGLSICREIVEAHGGEIHIESEAGEGTLITFTLLTAWEAAV